MAPKDSASPVDPLAPSEQLKTAQKLQSDVLTLAKVTDQQKARAAARIKVLQDRDGVEKKQLDESPFKEWQKEQANKLTKADNQLKGFAELLTTAAPDLGDKPKLFLAEETKIINDLKSKKEGKQGADEKVRTNQAKVVTAQNDVTDAQAKVDEKRKVLTDYEAYVKQLSDFGAQANAALDSKDYATASLVLAKAFSVTKNDPPDGGVLLKETRAAWEQLNIAEDALGTALDEATTAQAEAASLDASIKDSTAKRDENVLAKIRPLLPPPPPKK
jgi:hypothetical protein